MIKTLKIKNFKSISDLEVNFGKLTLLTGINSSGKSSTLQALLLVKQNFEKHYSALSITKDGSSMYMDSSGQFNLFPIEVLIKLLSKNLKIKDKYINLGSSENLLFEYAKDDKISISIESSDGLCTIDSDCLINESTDSINAEIQTEGNFEFLYKENLNYLSADRIVPQTTYDYSKDSVSKGFLGTRGEYTVHYLAENRINNIKISELKEESATSCQLVENVSKWLSRISKGINLYPEVNTELKQAILKYSYGGSKQMLPQNIGFGITYVLPIIVGILKSEPGEIIIIENPESHLHPSGQVELAKFISKAAHFGIQIILETHSDHILNSIRVSIKKEIISNTDVKTYYFSREVAKSTQIEEIFIDSNGKINNWPAGFFDEWNIQLEKLLW